MKILGIDTATWTASVGLSLDGAEVSERSLVTRGSHGSSLLGMIDEVLAAAGWRASDLQGIAVSIGPGSFTGLRIGLATAKGLAFALGIPVAGVRTLVAMAVSAGMRDGLVCPILDARKGEVYAALVEFRGGEATVVQPEVAVRLERWLEVVGERPCTFVGDAVALLPPHIRASWTAVPLERGPGCGAVVARLGEERITRGDSDSVADLEPLYCRPSEAELKHR